MQAPVIAMTIRLLRRIEDSIAMVFSVAIFEGNIFNYRESPVIRVCLVTVGVKS